MPYREQKHACNKGEEGSGQVARGSAFILRQKSGVLVETQLSVPHLEETERGVPPPPPDFIQSPITVASNRLTLVVNTPAGVVEPL